MPEIYTIWPCAGAEQRRGVKSLEDILISRVAEGYVGDPDRVNACKWIILTSGNDSEGGARRHYAARIEEVTRNPRLDRPDCTFACVDVKFGEPREIRSRSLDGLSWSSRNVRYIGRADPEYGPLMEEIIRSSINGTHQDACQR